MYYRRFFKKSLDFALALESITHEQYNQILDFYDLDKIIIKGREGVEVLRSVIPDISEEETPYDSIRDLYRVRVLKWPHLKIMCLKFAPKNPCLWKYVEETDDERVLFDYHLDTFSILRPTSAESVDGAHASGHGSD